MCQEIRHESQEKGHREGLQAGLQAGLQEGLLEGRRMGLIEVLELRFGALPAWAGDAIRSGLEGQLKGWLARAMIAQSLEAVFAAP